MWPREIQRELADWTFEAEREGEAYDLLAPFPLQWPGKSRARPGLGWPDPRLSADFSPRRRHLVRSHHQRRRDGSCLGLLGGVRDDLGVGPAERPIGTLDARGMIREPFAGPPNLFEWYGGWLDQAIGSLQ